MDEFVKWAFYGNVPEDLEMNAIYESYAIYCKLFGYDPMKKIKFIQEFIEWRG